MRKSARAFVEANGALGLEARPSRRADPGEALDSDSRALGDPWRGGEFGHESDGFSVHLVGR